MGYKDHLGDAFLYAGNADYIQTLFESYLTDPNTVDAEWRAFFQQTGDTALPVARETHQPSPAAARAAVSAGIDIEALHQAQHKQVRVLQLINAYRYRGHQRAHLDPLDLYERPRIKDLDLEYHELTEADLDTEFDTGSFRSIDEAKLREILRRLQKIYCEHIGVEYMHITDTVQKRWIQERLEPKDTDFGFSFEQRRVILERLTASEGMEHYLHTRYTGQKRFSLEGGESLIPLLDELIQRSGESGAREVVIGMAHRGRLNVLMNIFGKRPKDLFAEFEGTTERTISRAGDVKYHMGFSSDANTPGGPVHIVLAFNPSHLEIVNPVVEGSVRARQARRRDESRDQVVPILIHGDAAFSGQGVVMETINLSETRGYSTGGTVHVVINNQIGFTTSDPLDTRSTLYCTDVAKMVQAPIFHVNADDPEAVVFVTRLAMDFRTKFHKDVVVDMICYRRHGHNEADQPLATQPLMYQKIANLPTTRAKYAEKLEELGVISPGDAKKMQDNYRTALTTKDVVSETILSDYKAEYAVDWSPYMGGRWDMPVDTAVPLATLQQLSDKLTTLPDGFVLERSVSKVVEARKRMAKGEQPMDWGFAETMAYATLLHENIHMRLSGQDCGRGTFAHRHAMLHDQKTGDIYTPLRHLNDDTPDSDACMIINSLLSEVAVLGFEYGFSASEPETLIIWEAQFGDFANGAQVVIDQFIASSEAKWSYFSGLVMFLPHGYEGQGPEHSSARFERYLQLCAEDNMQVCMPSSPAQIFHLLRRQMLRPWRKPLVVMTPKSLLRRKSATSPLQSLVSGQFETVIADEKITPATARRVIFCSGKVYYDLLDFREKREISDIALVRIEQLYPFPADKIQQVFSLYSKTVEVVWCQEEPRNQGAWYYTRPFLNHYLPSTSPLRFVGRLACSSPAAGSMKQHLAQQQAIIDEVLGEAAIPSEIQRGV